MRRTVKACASLFRISLAQSFQYRLSALSGALTSLAFAVIDVVVFTVFYRYSDRAGFAGGLTLHQAVSYVWVRELLLFMTPYGIDGELLQKITNGDVGVEMCRPLDLYWHWFAKSAAGKVVVAVMRCTVCFGLGFLIPGGYGAKLPASPEALGMFLLSVLCAFLLCAAYGMLVVAVRTNISWGNGPMHFLCLVAILLSGGRLPLQLWPDALQPFLLLQPFAGLVDIPARLYIGSMPPSEAWFAMGVQLFWSAVFIALGKGIMASRLRNIVAQGG